MPRRTLPLPALVPGLACCLFASCAVGEPDYDQILKLSHDASMCSVAHYTRLEWKTNQYEMVVRQNKLVEMFADANAMAPEVVAADAQFRMPGKPWSIAASLDRAFMVVGGDKRRPKKDNAKARAFLAYYDTIGLEAECPLDPRVRQLIGKA